MKKLILPLLVSLIFTGCATTKISPEVQAQMNKTRTALQTAPVAILVNSCLLTNELGKDLVLHKASEQSSDKFVQTFTQQLNEHGVQISQSASPFICGLMAESQLKKFDIQTDQNSKRTAINTYPLLNSADSTMNAEQKNAVLKFNQYILKSDEVALANLHNKKEQLAEPQLDSTTVEILKDWSKSNYIFMVSLNGLDASVGSKFAMGTLSIGVTLATMGAGAGLVTAYVPKEGQHYTVQLFDLEKKQFVWNKNAILQGRVFSAKNHTLEANHILDPLFKSTDAP